MAYTPNWESLADALKRVMATGKNEDEAKTDLCHAVADRKIDVRVRIAANDHGMRGRFFSGRNVGVPPRLEPDSLDWLQSRPLEAWSIGPMPGQHYYSWSWTNYPIDLIELSTADVVEILCGAGLGDQAGRTSAAIAGVESAAIRALASHLRDNIGLKRAEAAEWCATSGFNLTDRGFQNRVWPQARAEAGLEAKAPPGRKALPGPKRKLSR